MMAKLLQHTQASSHPVKVVLTGDSLQVKRVNRSPHRRHVEVISDNPAYGRRDWPIDELEPIGRVLWIGKRV